MNSAKNTYSTTLSSSATKEPRGLTAIEELAQLQESILASVRQRSIHRSKSVDTMPPPARQPRSASEVRTIGGLTLNQRQINAYKWIMIGIAEDICPGYRVIPEQKEALNDIFNYCMGIRTETVDPTRGLWIYGEVGTGKSTLLKVVKEFAYRVRSCWGKDYRFRITTASQIAGEYTNKGYAALNSYVDNRFQAIDDLGNEPKNLRFYGSEGEPLTYVISMRYGQRRDDDFTHVTTNLSMKEVTMRYGFRAVDRIYEMFNLIHIPGTSLRPRPQ